MCTPYMCVCARTAPQALAASLRALFAGAEPDLEFGCFKVLYGGAAAGGAGAGGGGAGGEGQQQVGVACGVRGV